MDDLKKCRDYIDKIDDEIIKLYEKRMDIVKKVIEYKIQNNIDIQDKSRENAILIKNLDKIKNNQYKKYYEHVLEGFLKASKEIQNDIKKGSL